MPNRWGRVRDDLFLSLPAPDGIGPLLLSLALLPSPRSALRFGRETQWRHDCTECEAPCSMQRPWKWNRGCSAKVKAGDSSPTPTPVTACVGASTVKVRRCNLSM